MKCPKCQTENAEKRKFRRDWQVTLCVTLAAGLRRQGVLGNEDATVFGACADVQRYSSPLRLGKTSRAATYKNLKKYGNWR